MSKTALFLNYQVIAWLVDGEIERLTSNKSGIQKFLKENEKENQFRWRKSEHATK